MAPVSNGLPAIRRQLEFYFSDSNLPRDKFLRAKTEENEQGYVDISILSSFKRMQALKATPALIADAAASSTLVALDETKTRIRRTNPLPQVSLFNTRAVFAKGWLPNSQPPSIDELAALFSPSGKVLSVRIRRWVDDKGVKHFKGSVFVEMESPEAAERVVAEQYEIDTLDTDGKQIRKQLLLLQVEEYFEQKKAESRNRPKRIKKNKGEKRKAPDGENGENGENADVANGKAQGNANGEQNDAGNKGRQEEKKEDREMKPGLILKFEGFGPDVSREDIREAFETHGDIAWVDFQKGNSEGFIRFERLGAAKQACEAMTENKTEFGGKVPTFQVLSGEAEETYWKEMWEKKDRRIEQARKRRRENGKGPGGRGGRRFRGGGRKGGFRGGR